ncbi:hypothetical protein IJX73_03925, partial [bacterium]|nr:hypothetical protein [bacterium]MBQ9150060.1 hypothetical protein [bacterium]
KNNPAVDPADKHNLWYIGVSDQRKFDGIVKTIPWERMISGTNVEFDRAVENSGNNYTAAFNPTGEIKNLVVHAVGGGGAGGGIDRNTDLDTSVTPKTASAAQLKQMQTQLNERIKEKFGIDDAVIIDNKGSSIRNNRENPLYETNKWLALDTTDGTLVGKIDTRNPKKMLYPHDVLDWTESLGTALQESVVRDMPKIITQFDIGTTYKAGAGVKGENGGSAGDINTVITTDVDTQCMRKHGTTVPSGYAGYYDGGTRLVAWKCEDDKTYCNAKYTYSACGGCTPECPSTGGDSASAAKIDYNIGIENNIETFFDKIKKIFYGDEIDLRYPVAHAAHPQCKCECWFNNPPSETESCKVTGSMCSESSTKASCSGTKTRKYNGCDKRSNVCRKVACIAIKPNQYYKCESYSKNTYGDGNCGDSYNATSYGVGYCDGRSCERVGQWPNTIPGGSGGKAHAAYACVDANKGLVIIDDPMTINPVYVRNPGKNCNPDPVVINKVGTFRFTCVSNSLTNGYNGAGKKVQVSNPLGSAIAISSGGTGGKIYETADIKYETEIIYDDDMLERIAKAVDACNNNDAYEDTPEGRERAYADALGPRYSEYLALNAASTQAIADGMGGYMHESEFSIYDYSENVYATNQNNVETIKAGANKKLNCKDNGDRYVCDYPGSGSQFIVDFSSLASKEYTVSQDFICNLISGSLRGKNGADGYHSSYCSEADRKGIAADGKPYNYLYVWKIPYRINKLAFGEGGKPGEYATKPVNRVTGPLYITLGRGGQWANSTAWQQGEHGANGTDTVVQMDNALNSKNNVVVAKGGKGGSSGLESLNYDLCLATKDGMCKKDANDDSETGVSCCNQERGRRSTKDIIATAVKYSLFENIKALVGGSKIVGIGAGRGGEGGGTRAGFEETYGNLKIYNISAYNGYNNNNPLFVGNDNATEPPVAPANTTYKNYPYKPSSLNFKGGDGAVIITW